MLLHKLHTSLMDTVYTTNEHSAKMSARSSTLRNLWSAETNWFAPLSPQFPHHQQPAATRLHYLGYNTIPSKNKTQTYQRSDQRWRIFEINAEISWFAPLSPQFPHQQQPVATRLRYLLLTVYLTLSLLPKTRYIACSSVAYLRLSRPPSKIVAASLRMSGRLVKSTPLVSCTTKKDSRIRCSRCAHGLISHTRYRIFMPCLSYPVRWHSIALCTYWKQCSVSVSCSCDRRVCISLGLENRYGHWLW